MAQDLIVAAIVAACVVYAAWTLTPTALRRALASGLLKLPLPERVARALRRAAERSGGCAGCDACGREASRDASVKPLTLRRPPRR